MGNREIKYRIFLDGKFYYWGFIDGEFVEPITCAGKMSIAEAKERSQQYINCKDENDMEVYEGDLVRFTIPVDTPRTEREIRVVVWRDERQGFALQTICPDNLGRYWDCFIQKEIEVIDCGSKQGERSHERDGHSVVRSL